MDLILVDARVEGRDKQIDDVTTPAQMMSKGRCWVILRKTG